MHCCSCALPQHLYYFWFWLFISSSFGRPTFDVLLFRGLLLATCRYAIHRLEKLIQVRFDVYHRSIRDVKLSLLHAADGVFLQAQMHSQYLFALSYRPFGTSGFHEDKVRLLEVMMSREEPESCAFFVEFWDSIRQDFGMPDSSTMSEVWDRLPTTRSFQSKCTLPKLSRWFSWNQAFEEQRDSWHVLKAVLAYHFQTTEIDDPDTAAQKRELDALAKMTDEKQEEKINARKQFSMLKEKLGGGLRLAYYLLSNRLLQQILIISAVTRPLWTWYSNSVKDIKNSEDHATRLMELADAWQQDDHLQQTACVPTSIGPEILELFHRSEFANFDDTADKTFELTGHLLKHRVWSLSRASAPPDCYAELLHSNPQKRQACGFDS